MAGGSDHASKVNRLTPMSETSWSSLMCNWREERKWRQPLFNPFLFSSCTFYLLHKV